MRNAGRSGRGVRSLVVDGKSVTGNVIPLAGPGTTVRVTVELGLTLGDTLELGDGRWSVDGRAVARRQHPRLHV